MLVRPTADHVARAAVQWPGTTLADLERGRALYAARCGSCHVAPLPESRSAVMWPHIVADMVQKKKVPAADEVPITRFLVAVTSEDEIVR